MGHSTEARTKRLDFILRALWLCCLVVTGALALELWWERSETIEVHRAAAIAYAEAIALEVSDGLAEVEVAAEAVAAKLTPGKQDHVEPENIESALYSALEDTENIEIALYSALEDTEILFGAGVAFTPPRPEVFPEKLNGRVCLATYKIRPHAGATITDACITYDYTETNEEDPSSPDTNWYTGPIQDGSQWVDPFWGTASQSMLAAYSAVFTAAPDGNPEQQDPAGVVLFTVSLEGLGGLTESSQEDQGYAFIVQCEQQRGGFEPMVVSHPAVEPGLELERLTDLAKRTDDTLLRHANAVCDSQQPWLEGPDHFTGQPSVLAWHDIPLEGHAWKLVVVSPQTTLEGLARQGEARIRLALAVCTLLILSFMLIAGGRAIHSGAPRRLWPLSAACTLTLLGGMIFIWAMALRDQGYADLDLTRLRNQDSVETYLSKWQAKATQRQQATPLRVPTGMFLQSLEFVSSSNVEVTGYLWQRYDVPTGRSPCDEPGSNEAHELSRGFVFPEAVAFSASDEPECKPLDGAESLLWYFEATLRQPFDYRRYPFDHKAVWVRLWHQDFAKNVVLVPDLDAYTLLHPTAEPGLDEDLVTSGWNTEGSFFAYANHDYNTDFGIADYAGQQDFPELHFTVMLERNFFDAFISHLIPLFVVAGLLFALLLRGVRDGKKSTELVGLSSGLFFIVLLAHVPLRRQLATSDLLYLDHFYLVMYLAIMLVTLFTVAQAAKLRIPWLADHDYLMVKLLYWPVLSGVLLLISWVAL